MRIFLYFLLFKCFSFQYTDDCFDYNSNGTYGCFVNPSGCTNSNCSFIVKWQDMSNYLNFKIIYAINTLSNSTYIALGFSKDIYMGDDSVSMCRVYSNLMAVEAYYNFNASTSVDPGSDVAFTSDRTVGHFNSSISVNNNYMICSFSRNKTIAALNNKFFNLSNPYFMLLASGRTSSLGSPIYHLANEYSSQRAQNFQTKSSADFNLTSLSTTPSTATTKTLNGSCLKKPFTFKFLSLLAFIVAIILNLIIQQ